jgi:hypothetical protein
MPTTKEKSNISPLPQTHPMQAVVRVRCTQCPKILLPSFMPKHVREEHCPPKDRSCATCGKVCKSKNILNRHKRKKSCRSSCSLALPISSDHESFDDDSQVALPAEYDDIADAGDMGAIGADMREGGLEEVPEGESQATGDHTEAQQVMLFGAPTIEQLQTPRGALTSPSQYYSGATSFVGLNLSSQLQAFQAFISSESQLEQVYLLDLI